MSNDNHSVEAKITFSKNNRPISSEWPVCVCKKYLINVFLFTNWVRKKKLQTWKIIIFERKYSKNNFKKGILEEGAN